MGSRARCCPASPAAGTARVGSVSRRLVFFLPLIGYWLLAVAIPFYPRPFWLLLRDSASEAEGRQFLRGTVEVDAEGVGPVTTAYSDHYGVALTIAPPP